MRPGVRKVVASARFFPHPFVYTKTSRHRTSGRTRGEDETGVRERERERRRQGKEERKEGRLFPRATTWYTRLLSLCRMRAADRVAIADERPVYPLSLFLFFALLLSPGGRCTSIASLGAAVHLVTAPVLFPSTNYYLFASHCYPGANAPLIWRWHFFLSAQVIYLITTAMFSNNNIIINMRENVYTCNTLFYRYNIKLI